MELEVRGVSGAARDRLRGRVESHRAELKRLTQEFESAKKPKSEIVDLGLEESWDNGITEEQRKRLLDASERIDRTGRTLQNGYRMVLETEEIGSQVLKDLHDQRETIQRSRGRVINFLIYKYKFIVKSDLLSDTFSFVIPQSSSKSVNRNNILNTCLSFIWWFIIFQLRDTDAELGRGSRLLSGMILRALQQRLILALVTLVLISMGCFVIYYSFKS